MYVDSLCSVDTLLHFHPSISLFSSFHQLLQAKRVRLIIWRPLYTACCVFALLSMVSVRPPHLLGLMENTRGCIHGRDCRKPYIGVEFQSISWPSPVNEKNFFLKSEEETLVIV